jgi:hypothetical protein
MVTPRKFGKGNGPKFSFSSKMFYGNYGKADHLCLPHKLFTMVIICFIISQASIFNPSEYLFNMPESDLGLNGVDEMTGGCSSLRLGETFVENNKEIYDKIVKQRYQRLQEYYQGDPDHVVPWDGARATYLWDFFPPSWNCPYRDRLGRFSEGGKVVCNVDALQGDTKAVVYSYGVRDDISFEMDLAARTNVSIYAFDPTVESLPQAHENIIFSKKGLGSSNDGLLESLDYTMRRLDHKHISLLKVDCEGCEWDAFRHKAAQEALGRVDQLLIELHFKQHETNNNGENSYVKDVFEFFELMETQGLFPFSWEVNHNPSGHFQEKPWAIEYSFVRWNSSYMCFDTSKANSAQNELLSRKEPMMDTKVEPARPVIVYLATPDEVENLKKSVSLLGNAFKSQDIPVLIYYDDDRFLEFRTEIADAAKSAGFSSSLSFVPVRLELPRDCCDFEPTWSKRSKFGYHNMIRFWIKDLWQSKSLLEGDYTHVMRLDTDSFIQSVQTDATPLIPSGSIYRGNSMQYDEGNVVEGFYEFVKAMSQNSRPKNQHIIDDILNSWEHQKRIPMIYNNFFIGKIEFFQRKDVVDMVERMCCTAPDFHVYRHRWGDALIHYFLLGMFAEKQEIILNAPLSGYSHVG